MAEVRRAARFHLDRAFDYGGGGATEQEVLESIDALRDLLNRWVKVLRSESPDAAVLHLLPHKR